VRALNLNALASVTLQVAQTGGNVADISREDIEELPDLGSKLQLPVGVAPPCEAIQRRKKIFRFLRQREV
jgi:hypothetical protein